MVGMIGFQDMLQGKNMSKEAQRTILVTVEVDTLVAWYAYL